MDKNRLEEYREASTQVKSITCTDERQKDILTNMYFAACSLIGGLENTMEDYPEDSEDYISAKEALEEHDVLVDDIHAMCLTGFYGIGFEGCQQAYQKNYNFAGTEFIRNCAEEVVKAMGY